MRRISIKYSASAVLFIVLILVQDSVGKPTNYNKKSKPKPTPAPVQIRTHRALPSVSDDHYSELLPDGTYKYAYTGINTYHAEKRSPDGTVEGETLVIRPDGVPVKTHYIADKRGYRPKTEVLYKEKLLSKRA